MIEKLYSIFLKASGVSTDSRNIKPGSIFFALKGENFNGNKFAKEALSKGAVAAVIDEAEYNQKGLFLVKDVLLTLQKLASYHRDRFDIPVVALTGSNGKTTTKELLASVLKQKYTVHYTKGNLNNHIGVPLTLLEMPSDTEIALIEMGANHQGEIKQLAAIAKPNFGLITNIGKAHLEGFGGIEGVKKGKLELYDYVSNNGGHFFVDSHDMLLNQAITKNRVVYQTFSQIRVQPTIEFMLDKFLVKSELFGLYNLQNIQAATSIGRYFEVNILDVVYGIERYRPSNNRSEIIRVESNLIILDAYNANPTSMKLSIENFNQRPGRKIAILGSMKEIGADSEHEHKLLVEYANNCDIEEVIFFGEEFEGIKVSAKNYLCSGIDQAKRILNLSGRRNYSILIKGSRANRLESILN